MPERRARHHRRYHHRQRAGPLQVEPVQAPFRPEQQPRRLGEQRERHERVGEVQHPQDRLVERAEAVPA